MIRHTRLARLTSAVALVLSLVLAAPVVGQSGQRIEGGVLTDHDLKFRLTPPNRTWSVLGEDAATAIVPDATAMLQSRGGLAFAVICERVGTDVTLDGYLDLVTANVGFETLSVEPRRSATVDGEPARVSERIVDTGTRVRIAHTVVRRGEFGVQFVLFGPAASTPSRLVSELLETVELLDGEIQLRASSLVIESATGPDWMVEDGRFVGLGSGTGIVVDPDPEFARVVIGDELLQIGDGTVGMATRRGDCFVLVTTLRATPAEAEAVLAGVRSYPPEDVREFRWEILGAERPAQRWNLDFGGVNYSFRQVEWTEAGEAGHLLCWHAADGADLPADLTDRIAAALRRPTEAEATLLRERLELWSDPVARVTAEQTLRDGHFLDFEHGVSWSAPESGHWRLFAASDLVSIERSWLALLARDASRGLEVTLAYDDAGGLSDGEYHSGSVAAYVDGLDVLESKTLEPRPAGAGTLHTTHVTYRVLDAPHVMWIATAVRDGVGIDLVITATASCAAAADDLARAALSGLRVHETLETAVDGDGDYLDRRFGFRIRKGGNERVMTMNDPRLGGLGVMTQLSRQGRPRLQVVAVCAPAGEANLDAVRGNLVATLFGDASSDSTNDWRPAMLGGRASERMVLTRRGKPQGVVHLVGRGSMAWIVVAFGEVTQADAALRAFAFVRDPFDR